MRWWSYEQQHPQVGLDAAVGGVPYFSREDPYVWINHELYIYIESIIIKNMSCKNLSCFCISSSNFLLVCSKINHKSSRWSELENGNDWTKEVSTVKYNSKIQEYEKSKNMYLEYVDKIRLWNPKFHIKFLKPKFFLFLPY
jgi:hypothetical protein